MFLIMLAGFLAYSNTFSVPFHFDDNPGIVQNPVIRDLRNFMDPSSASGYHNIFKDRYVGFLSFALNYRLHGLDVAGYHIVNLAVHILNALLVYWLVIVTFQTPFFVRRGPAHGSDHSQPAALIALFSALLFVSHPVQTQAVTYIVQRFTSLAALFYLCSLVLYIHWRIAPVRTQRTGPPARFPFSASRLPSFCRYAASVACSLLAMKTKEIAFTLPVVIALYEFLFFEGRMSKRVLWLVPLFLTMLIVPLSLLSGETSIDGLLGAMDNVTRSGSALSRGDYLITQFRVIVTYLRLLILPVNQYLEYDYPASHSFLEPAVLLSFLLLVSIFGLGVYLLRRSRFTNPVLRLSAFGIFWFFITLSVESSIIPISGIIFEHRCYLPSVGFFAAVTASLFSAPAALRRERVIPHAALIVISALGVAVLMGAAYARNRIWKDEVRLWENVLQGNPDNPRAYNNLGIAYAAKKEYGQAIENYRKAIELNPRNTLAYINLGNAYDDMGAGERALEAYDAAIQLSPRYASAYYDRALAYYRMGKVDKAIADYRQGCALGYELACRSLEDVAGKR